MSFDRLAAFRFVLVEPRYAGNVGAAARALKNLGFSDLALVSPYCSTSDEEAVRFAVDAVDLLDAARVSPSLDLALIDVRTAVGTSRRMGKQRRPHVRIDELAPRLARLGERGDVAIVFGREADGLTDDELDRCTHLAYIPTADAYPAMNLAQSVAVVAYEIARAVDALAPAPPPRPLGSEDDGGDESLATHAAREEMFAHLADALAVIGFLKDGQAEGMMRRVRRILGRAELSEGDVSIVRGIARQILWLSREARVDERKPRGAPGG